MKRYQLNIEAQRDMDSIAEYLSAQASVERAVQVILDFSREFRKLGDQPGIGHFREDVLDRHFKFWRVHSYLICYRWDVTPIQIIAVVHGARDLDAFFEDRSSGTVQ